MVSSTELEEFRGVKSVCLTILNETFNHADRLVSVIRGLGYPLQYQPVKSPRDWQQTLEKESLDLVLLGMDQGDLSPQEVIEAVRKQQPDAILVLLADSADSALLPTTANPQIRDLVAREDIPRLCFCLTRELGRLRAERKIHELEQQLEEAEHRCHILLDSATDAIAYVHEGMHMHANPNYLELFGYLDMDDLVGLPVMDLVESAHRESLKRALRKVNETQEPLRLELQCCNEAGETFDAAVELSPAHYDGEPCLQIWVRDQGLDREMENRIRQLSRLDDLTGLPDRRNFQQQLEQCVEQLGTPEGSRALLYIVVDGFQQLRGQAGIAASDQILRELAGVLQARLGDGDLLARFGDHSFTLLYHESNPALAEDFAKQLQKALGEHVFESLLDYQNPTLSIGVAISDEPAAESAHELLNRAYRASAEIHEAGGNGVVVYEAQRLEEVNAGDRGGNETNLVEMIDFALQHDRFRLAYQPIVSLQGDTRENYAVLVRLLDRNNEEILPEHFLRQAASVQRLAAIDRWVIQHALEELARQRRNGGKINFFIPISRDGIQDDTLLLWICDCLRDANAKGAWVTFQFHEEDVRTHLRAAQQLIEGIRKINCKVAIDHFGRGQKAEKLLDKLPADFFKLDNRFTRDLTDNHDSQLELQALNECIQQHNARSIATAVEDANSLSVLWGLGVNYIQGYFVQEPASSINTEFAGQ